MVTTVKGHTTFARSEMLEFAPGGFSARKGFMVSGFIYVTFGKGANTRVLPAGCYSGGRDENGFPTLVISAFDWLDGGGLETCTAVLRGNEVPRFTRMMLHDCEQYADSAVYFSPYWLVTWAGRVGAMVEYGVEE